MLYLVTKQNAESASFANQERQTYVAKFVWLLELVLCWMIARVGSLWMGSQSTISWVHQPSVSIQLFMMLVLLKFIHRHLSRRSACLAVVSLLVIFVNCNSTIYCKFRIITWLFRFVFCKFDLNVWQLKFSQLKILLFPPVVFLACML